MPIKAIATLALAGAASSVLAAPVVACDALRPGLEARVVAVPDGDSVILDSGQKVRLTGIQAPKLPLGRPEVTAWPLAEDARAALEALALDQQVEIRFDGAERDRHGRVLGHMFVGQDKVWAEDALLREGMARVYSFADNRACVGELLRAEAVARAEKAGVWADPYYAILQADRPKQILDHDGDYVLVEGRVLKAEVTGGRLYLNFGHDWDSDFTVTAGRPALRLFDAAGFDAAGLQDALVRVRGWLETWDGPRIEVSHPEQIEVLAWR